MLVRQSWGTVLDLYGKLHTYVNQDNPTTIRALRNSGRISSIHQALLQWSCLTISATSTPVVRESPPNSAASVSTVEDILA